MRAWHNKMFLEANLSKNTWTVEPSDSPYVIDLTFSFVDDSGKSEVVFTNLSFGAKVYLNNELFYEKSFPEENTIYESSDQKVIAVARVSGVIPEYTYKILVWAENNGTYFETEVAHTIPRPNCIFPSWIWDSQNKIWTPPTPVPCCDDYRWDESSLSWLLVEG
jgi:hypothetical protein